MAPDPRQLVAEEKEPPRPATGPRPVQLAEGDTELFRLINHYRLLTRDHLAALTSRDPKRIHRRLLKLIENGYLKRRTPPLARHIYSMGSRGLSVLLTAGLISDEDAERRLREHELRDATLAHEMMIADIHVMLEIASRESPVKLVAWRQGKELAHTIDDGSETITIEPDAFFGLEDTRVPAAENRSYFLLEADRSTEPKVLRPGSIRFRDKFRKYTRYIHSGGHTAKYGKQYIRVVTITQTTLRRNSLAADAERPDLVPENLRKYFLFGSRKDFSLDNPTLILGPVFLQPGRPAPRTLMRTVEL